MTKTNRRVSLIEDSYRVEWGKLGPPRRRIANCERLKSDYRYSVKIAATAQGILDARKRYPDSSFADLYDELTMPIELRKAHEANDRAVMKAYGFKPETPESEIVAKLMERYEALADR